MMRTVLTPHLRYVSWLALFVVAITSCNSSDSPTRSLTVSATTTPTQSSGSPGGASGGSLTFSTAQLVLRKVMLAPVDSSCDMEDEDTPAPAMSSDSHEGERDGDDDGDEDGCAVLKVGPLTVDLPLDATTALVLDALVPAGSYKGVMVQLDAIKVSGTFTPTGGTSHPFDFTSRGHAAIHIQFPAPITVGPGTSNVTVTVDVASWFKNSSGAALDPADPANAETITRNVKQSFRAFGDNDHDGVDDRRHGDD
jgi:hypothetical protein